MTGEKFAVTREELVPEGQGHDVPWGWNCPDCYDNR